MKPRHFKLLTLWILPLLVVRALIPAGYMLSASATGLELMFCPGTVASIDHSQHAGHAGSQGADSKADPGVDPHAAHKGHADQQMVAQHASGHHDTGHHGSHDSGSGAHDNAPCPFSLVAGAALPEVPYLAAAAFAPADDIVELTSTPVISTGPIRTDRIRGPPLFS